MALEFFTKGMKYDDIFAEQVKAWETRMQDLEKETKFNAGLGTELRKMLQLMNAELQQLRNNVAELQKRSTHDA